MKTSTSRMTPGRTSRRKRAATSASCESTKVIATPRGMKRSNLSTSGSSRYAIVSAKKIGASTSRKK
jgi:hypothetical protein